MLRAFDAIVKTFTPKETNYNDAMFRFYSTEYGPVEGARLYAIKQSQRDTQVIV